ncbi:NAD-dependent epimerase/dehydratase family protein [Wenxinia saemankumensis]|uniref:Nucleoside-diphosphate-sugar epimerase n=1 Tax=Wenxinia saemankumensis TaxID=1447782 RepID=A0A1M6FZ98_9RHOB|nr:NAD-dependent epimerase/dehydratase family protein [Wenxinia saemankumensis]SHJ02964.1 Nucleoside-diphosphate-sugar epimerase [Wenxinia saemankumensis]
MGALRLLVTGATGYVGAAVVREALARGHAVRVLSRDGRSGGRVRVVTGDLLDADTLARAVDGIDAVIHCASPLVADDRQMTRITVTGTARLFRAAAAAGVGRLVLAGSMGVYAGRPEARIDETSPVEPRPEARDVYTRAKIAQEAVAREHRGGTGLWVLRLGAVWGAGRLAHGHVARLGPVRVTGPGELPILQRAHAGEALVRAAETAPDGAEVLNVLDADRPTRAAWDAATGRTGPALSWRLLDAAAGLPLPGKPGLLRRPALRARLAPMTYDTARAEARLGWRGGTPFAEAMAEALE